MTEWIRLRAEGIRQAEKERKEERERLVVVAAQLKAQTEPFWNELVRVLEESVRQFNIEFPEAERRIDAWEKNSATAVTIRRNAYPAAIVKINFNNAGTAIPYAMSLTARKGASVVENQANLVVGVIEGEPGYADEHVHCHEDAAKVFLEPFFSF
jgi:hypothetical protein